jgi:hypothetical protein
MGRGLLAILLIVLCGFYTVPLIAVSFLANLAVRFDWLEIAVGDAQADPFVLSGYHTIRRLS